MAVNDGFSQHYEYVDISGTKCIEWNFPPLTGVNDSRDKARRRRCKDYVGLEHLETPMLDSKMSKSGKCYCDVIILTGQLAEWERLMTVYYASEGYDSQTKSLGTFGHQVSWSNEESPIISVNFYPSKGKFVVQPGERNSERLYEWLAQYAIWKTQITETANDENDDRRTPQADVRKTPTAPPESNDDRQLENNQSEERVIPSAPLLPEEDGVGAFQASSGVNMTSPLLLVEASSKASPAVSDDAGVMAAIFAMEKRMMDVIHKNNHQWRQMYLITADRERKKYEEKIQSLEEDSVALRAQVAKLTTDTHQCMWNNFTKSTPSNPKVLLMISSIITRY